MSESSSEKAYRLRIPEVLYDDIEKWAEEEVRSVNGQIIIILRDAVARWKLSRGRKVETEEDILTPELVAG